MIPRMKKESMSFPKVCRHSDRSGPLAPVLGTPSSRLFASPSRCLASLSSVRVGNARFWPLSWLETLDIVEKVLTMSRLSK